MERYRKIPNGVTPPVVVSEKRRKKEKYIDWNQGGGTESKGVGWYCKTFRRSTQLCSETTNAETRDAEADEVEKRDGYPSSEGGKKETADKDGYNHFTISPLYYLHCCTILVLSFHHNGMKVFLLYHFIISWFYRDNMCIFYAPFHHINFNIALYKIESVFVRPFHHITIILKLHNR